jgi:predicted AlkP superfamily phosphohydrolase/phosphomutase
MSTKALDRRAVVIGLDGADPDLITPWIDAGELPTLAKLREQGVWGRLASTLPPMSAGAWTSFMTGKNPGKHGVFDFLQRSPESYHLAVSRRSTEPTLWGLLSEAGKRVAVLNVPQTYPPEEVNGVMLSGLGTPVHRDGVYPKSLAPYVRQSGFRQGMHLQYRPGEEDSFLRQVYDSTRRRFKVAMELATRERWDLFVHVFRGTDELAHFFWRHMDASHPDHDPGLAAKYGDALLQFYRHVDRLAGELLDTLGQDAWVFVISDHGMGPLYKNVFLNEWLRQAGFLAIEESASTGLARRGLRRLGLTRDGATAFLKRLGMGKVHLALRALLSPWLHIIPEDDQLRLSDLVDWSRTSAYSHGYIGQIYVNLSGREPRGIVAPGKEYEILCDRLSDGLQRLVDPDDQQPIVDRVIRRDEIFHGRYLDQAPDLMVLMRGLTYITHEGFEFSESGQVLVPPVTHESGGHRLDGILLAAGPGIRAGQEIRNASLIDLAPSLLALMGSAVPADMDGRILTTLFADGVLDVPSGMPIGDTQRAQLVEEAAWSEEDEQEIMERLRNLGYL